MDIIALSKPWPSEPLPLEVERQLEKHRAEASSYFADWLAQAH